jgi:putative DNA primase/helicase
VINALLGDENFSTYTLQSLTDTKGYQRAKIGNKLVNYSSEINQKMNTAYFKQLVSGEPVEARLPYGEPFIMTNYAKLMFNCNELPSDVEHTHAFFRRFLIIPFEVTIPEAKQEKDFAQKIIRTELSGVFNWVLDGLQRVLKQKGFTQCDIIASRNKQFRHDSDSVLMFLSERGFKESFTKTTPLKELYGTYTSFCKADRHHPVAKNTFSKRLENAGYKKKKESEGMAFYLIHT